MTKDWYFEHPTDDNKYKVIVADRIVAAVEFVTIYDGTMGIYINYHNYEDDMHLLRHWTYKKLPDNCKVKKGIWPFQTHFYYIEPVLKLVKDRGVNLLAKKRQLDKDLKKWSVIGKHDFQGHL